MTMWPYAAGHSPLNGRMVGRLLVDYVDSKLALIYAASRARGLCRKLARLKEGLVNTESMTSIEYYSTGFGPCPRICRDAITLVLLGSFPQESVLSVHRQAPRRPQAAYWNFGLQTRDDQVPFHRWAQRSARI